MVQVVQADPLVMGADKEDCEKGQRYVKVRYQSLAQAQFANQQLYLAQEALQQTQEDLRLAQWRLEDARRQGARALKREKVWQALAIVFVVIDAAWLWRAL